MPNKLSNVLSTPSQALSSNLNTSNTSSKNTDSLEKVIVWWAKRSTHKSNKKRQHIIIGKQVTSYGQDWEKKRLLQRKFKDND